MYNAFYRIVSSVSYLMMLCFKIQNVAPILCGENSYNQPISGDSPLLPVSSVLLKNVTPTSIVTKTAFENTVAYVGVKSGKILKVTKL